MQRRTCWLGCGGVWEAFRKWQRWVYMLKVEFQRWQEPDKPSARRAGQAHSTGPLKREHPWIVVLRYVDRAHCQWCGHYLQVSSLYNKPPQMHSFSFVGQEFRQGSDGYFFGSTCINLEPLMTSGCWWGRVVSLMGMTGKPLNAVHIFSLVGHCDVNCISRLPVSVPTAPWGIQFVLLASESQIQLDFSLKHSFPYHIFIESLPFAKYYWSFKSSRGYPREVDDLGGRSGYWSYAHEIERMEKVGASWPKSTEKRQPTLTTGQLRPLWDIYSNTYWVFFSKLSFSGTKSFIILFMSDFVLQ